MMMMATEEWVKVEPNDMVSGKADIEVDLRKRFVMGSQENKICCKVKGFFFKLQKTIYKK